MKKILLIATLVGACSSAFAKIGPSEISETYDCTNAIGQSLTVNVQTLHTQFVSAHLKTAEGEKSFNGNSTLYTSQFKLQSETGEEALLAIVTPVKPGHGCGRCATSDDDFSQPPFYYGQLLYAGTHYNFTCQKLK